MMGDNMKKGYKQTKIGVIPEEWEVKKLDEVTLLLKDGTHGTHKDIENGIPLLSAKDISNGKIFIQSDSRRISKEDYDKIHKNYEIEKEDILMTIVGSIGRTALVTDEIDKFTLQRSVGIIRIKKDISSNFVKYYFDGSIYQKQLMKEISASAQGGVYLKSLARTQISIPPLQEQKKIATILSSVDNHIDEVDSMIKDLKELKKGLMQKLLTNGIGHTEFKDSAVGRIPVEWEVKTLGEIGNTYNGLTGKTKDDFGRGMPYIPYKNIFRNTKINIINFDYVEINNNDKQNAVKYGDIFFTTSSEIAEEAGMSSVLLDEYSELYLNSFCFGYRLNSFEILKPKYARYLLRGEKFRKSISTIAQGSTRYNLSKGNVMKLNIPIPPLQEQSKIADILSSVDKRIDIYESERTDLIDFKKGLMQQLLTGRTRV